MDAKGQLSVEYLLLTLVFLIIIGSVTIPLLVIPAINASLDVSDTSQVSASINSITNAVGIVYANGPGSKRTINVFFPSNGTLAYNAENSTIYMNVGLLSQNNTNNNTNNKTIDANVPIAVNINTATSKGVSKGNYNVTVTWANGASPISIELVPS